MKINHLFVYLFIVVFTAMNPVFGQTPGQQKWTDSTGGSVDGSPAIGSDGTVYVTSTDGRLYSINPGSGQVNWNVDLHNTVGTSVGDTASSPAIGPDGTIYVCATDGANGSLYAIKPDGSFKWPSPVSLNSFFEGEQDVSTPAIGSDGTIYVTGDDYFPSLYAVNPDGSLKWSIYVNDVESSPVIGPDCTVYFTTEDGSLCAVNNSGQLKWTYQIFSGDFFISSLAVDSDGTIYVGSGDQNLYAINPDGTGKWKFPTGGFIQSAPAIGPDGTIYIGSSDNNLYAVNPNGGQKWAFPTGGAINSSPAIASDGTVYFGSSDNNLYAINSNGSQKWVFQTGGAVNSSPALGTNGTVYVGSGDGNVYAVYGSAALASSAWPMFAKNAAHTASQAASICPAECTTPYLNNSQISAGTFSFSINNGPPGTYWEIFESTDLQNWTWVDGVLLDSEGNGSFSDGSITGVAHRFYKLSNGDCCSQAIGFERLTANTGYTAIANQLDAPLNTLDGLFNPTMPDGTSLPAGTVILIWNQAQHQFVNYTWNGGQWSPNGNATLSPGDFAFIQNNSGTPFTVTFVGLVEEGQLTIPLASGVHALSSKVPQAGGITSTLGYQPQDGDYIEQWLPQAPSWKLIAMYYDAADAYPDPAGWYDWDGNPAEPMIGVGEGFVLVSAAGTWTRTFSACSGQTCTQPALNNTQISSSTFSFNAVGLPGTYWGIYESSDLESWALVSGVILDGSGNGSFTDNNITGVAHRFYKLSNGDCCSQAIGFERLTANTGYTAIANQLDAPLNTLDGLFNPTMPDGTSLPAGTVILIWNQAQHQFVNYTWNGGQWSPNGNATLSPGDFAFIQNNSGTPFTVTFVGLVEEGQLTIPLASGVHALSSKVPQAGGITSTLGYQPQDGDYIEQWLPQAPSWKLIAMYYDAADAYPDPAGWYDWDGNPAEPMIGVGEGFVLVSAAGTWTRTFSACSGQTCTQPALNNTQISSSTFSFNIIGPPGTYWGVSESSDLENWALVSGVILDGSGNGSFTDNNITGVAHRFYKLSNGDCCSQAIGFERLTAGTGYTAIANQLDAPLNTLDGLFSPTMPDGTSLPAGTVILIWNQAQHQFVNYTWNGGQWSPNGNATLSPGDFAFIQNNSGTPFTVTFVGLVEEGQLTIPLASGVHALSSKVPQAGGITSTLGYQPQDGDYIEQWLPQAPSWKLIAMYYDAADAYPDPAGWYDWDGNPAEPMIGVGEGFVLVSAAGTWTRTFSACH